MNWIRERAKSGMRGTESGWRWIKKRRRKTFPYLFLPVISATWLQSRSSLLSLPSFSYQVCSIHLYTTRNRGGRRRSSEHHFHHHYNSPPHLSFHFSPSSSSDDYLLLLLNFLPFDYFLLHYYSSFPLNNAADTWDNKCSIRCLWGGEWLGTTDKKVGERNIQWNERRWRASLLIFTYKKWRMKKIRRRRKPKVIK